MLNRILLSLISILVFLLSACQSSASTFVPTESSTSSLSETDNVPNPTFTPTPNNTTLSAPTISEEHAKAFYNYAYSSISTIVSWDLLIDSANQNSLGSYGDLYRLLASEYLTASLLYPDIRKDIVSQAQKKHKEKIDLLNAFFDSADAMEDKTSLVGQAIQEFDLLQDSPTPTFKSSSFDANTNYTFDPTDPSNQSIINIAQLNYSDPTKPPPPFDDPSNPVTFSVTGSLIDPVTLTAQPAHELQIGTPIIEPYNLQIPVEGAVEWANIRVLDQQGHVVGYYLAANRPLGIPHVMAMRSLPLANQYESILPSWVYDTQDPTSLPVVPQEQLESAMRKNLDNALQKAVAFGDIGQDEADTLLNEFNDPQLISVVKDPALRAAVLLSASIKSAGGDLILPILLQQNGHNTSIKMYFEDDPEFVALFNGSNTLPFFRGGALVGYAGDGKVTIVWDKTSKDGQESIEDLAALMPHEVIIHDTLQISMSEETVADLMQAVAWARLVQRDPSLVTKNTFITRNNNLLLYVLLNSVFVDDQAILPFKSHVGLVTRITGVQTHNQADYNALPRNSTQQIKNFYELIQELNDQPVSPMAPVSAGSNITLELFKILFGTDVVIPSQLGHSDPNGETIPDFSELLLTDFIDQRVQQLIPDETFKELAQDLHMTLNESASP